MIVFDGSSINIQDPVLCRVALAYDSSQSGEYDFIFSNCYVDSHKKFAGILTTSPEIFNNINSSKGFIFDHEEPVLNEGDIFLLDPAGRAIKLYDRLSATNSILLTERCNCNCLMCPQPPKNNYSQEIVDYSIDMISLMNTDTQYIGITGGEPTLEWNGLINVLEACQSHLPYTYIQLLTNARILKDYSKAEELKRITGDKLLAGVPIYSDIDSIHDELCSAKGAFWETIDGIYNLERAGIPIELRIVITKMNYDRLPDFSEFVYRTMPFVQHVAFMAMEPIGNAIKNINKLWIDTSDYILKLEMAVHKLWQRGINVSLFNHQLCTLPKKLWPLAKKSISDWKVIYMDECKFCNEKMNCGGFFFSAQDYKSRSISRI
jgi:His-Xaa-Ser system radical SAM maturase HxsC